MTRKEIYNFLRKNGWITILLILSLIGTTLAICGFCQQGYNFSESLYRTFQLFFLNILFGEDGIEISYQLQWARWLILTAFLWATFRLFVEIIAPQFFKNLKIRFCYRNHIIICGLNKITISLIEKFKDKQIIVLAEERNKYAENLKTKGVSLFLGDFSNDFFWKKTKLGKANILYSIIDNDNMNVKIVQSVFAVLEKENRTEPLKCFALINDRKLKNVLEESNIFKQKTDFLDITLFNTNEIGIKYGIAKNINKILPAKIEIVPEILLIGVTEKTEIILLNLAHCLTMKQENFKFTIVEENQEKIRLFKKRNAYLFEENFTEINFVTEIEGEKQFDSILVCLDNPTEAIKKANEIRCLLVETNSDKYIFIFCNGIDIFNKVLKDEWEKKNIFMVNLFSEIADYVFNLDKDIEEKAKEAHYFWNTLYNQNTEWDKLTGHFKQSNRNQILDNYLRFYIARGKSFGDFKNRLISFSDKERETLAMMEHRRWLLEKFDNGWRFGKRNNELKRHDCLCCWKKLPEEQQAKDYNAIDLMIKLLNNQTR
jgi:voltage-gated potassium channel Kch